MSRSGGVHQSIVKPQVLAIVIGHRIINMRLVNLLWFKWQNQVQINKSATYAQVFEKEIFVGKFGNEQAQFIIDRLDWRDRILEKQTVKRSEVAFSSEVKKIEG